VNLVRLEATLKIARSERLLATSGDEWDSDPWLLGVGNGVVNLRTGKLRDGKRSDFLTMHTDVVFDPGAACPQWLNFLNDIFGGDDERGPHPHIISESGERSLDGSAKSAIDTSNPFQRLPSGFAGNELQLRFAFYYNMPIE
jgi:hypothetical protein